MVFFTCNHCGDSVKKPAVEKHYNTKCSRNPVFVSCMDCLKDFREDFVSHTKCISEAEKYSGKDYVPKESKNSGLKKQESWLEIVRSILSTTEYEVTPAVRGIFQRLQTYDNVPRKKAKFENFVSNSMRIRKQQAEEVWNVLEKALEKLKGARSTELKKSENGTDKPGENDNNETQEIQENGQHVEEGDKDNSEREKKKNKKKVLEESNEVVDISDQNPDEPPKKKKKKSKTSKTTVDENSPQEAADIALTTNGNMETSEQLSKKSKKSKKKAKDAENLGTESPANVEGEEKSSPRKSRETVGENGSQNGSEIISSTNGNMETSEESPKKSKKSKKKTENGRTESLANVEDEEKSSPEKIKGPQEATEITLSTNGNVENSEKMPKKSKKSKRDIEDTKNDVAENQDEPPSKIKKPDNDADETCLAKPHKFKVSGFDWMEVIFNIVGKHNEEISLEKLKAKVLKKYKARYQLDTIPWKLNKTFDKKLRKSGLLVENDIVKMNAK